MVGWYGRFWRRFWFEQFTGRPSLVPMVPEPPPDWKESMALLDRVLPLAAGLVSRAKEMVRLTARRPLPVSALQQMQLEENKARQTIVALSLQFPATASLAVALVRDTHNDDSHELTGMAEARLATYRRWQNRLHTVAAGFRTFKTPQGFAPRGTRMALPMAPIG